MTVPARHATTIHRYSDQRITADVTPLLGVLPLQHPGFWISMYSKYVCETLIEQSPVSITLCCVFALLVKGQTLSAPTA